jgi:hypothetical protein
MLVKFEKGLARRVIEHESVVGQDMGIGDAWGELSQDNHHSHISGLVAREQQKTGTAAA